MTTDPTIAILRRHAAEADCQAAGLATVAPSMARDYRAKAAALRHEADRMERRQVQQQAPTVRMVNPQEATTVVIKRPG